MGKYGLRHLGAAIAALMLASSAQAAEWWYVTEAASDDVFFVDTQSMVSAGGVATFWYYAINNKVKDGVFGNKSHTSIDCTKRKITYLISVYYDTDGKATGTFGSQPAVDVIPDTVADGIRKFVCAAPAQRAAVGEKLIITPEDYVTRMKAIAAAPR